MEVRIYAVSGEAMPKVKAVLEAEDMFEVKAKCAKCGQVLEGKIKASEYSQYLPVEKGGKELPPKKTCKCGGAFHFEKKELLKNEFARTGYVLRGAESLDMEEGNFLYIKADEEFFKKNEAQLLQAGAKKASEDEAHAVKEKIESEEEAAAAGMGGGTLYTGGTGGSSAPDYAQPYGTYAPVLENPPAIPYPTLQKNGQYDIFGVPFSGKGGESAQNGTNKTGLAALALGGMMTGAAALYFARKNTPTATMTASPAFVPKEDVVGRGVFNFFDAFKLKDQYGYTMGDALAVAYNKNKAVNAMNSLTYAIDETQTARIAEADKYQWPISSAVKFAASFARETGAATTALIGNGLFAVGAASMLLFDSLMNPKDAGENFSAIAEAVMGSLFRGVYRMGSTIKNEDPEVSAGMVMSFAIAPEEAALERSGRLVRVARATRKAKSTGKKLARETGMGVDVGTELGERTAIKSMETGELASLAELIEEQAGESAGECGKTLIQISDVNTENK
ncbi:MAG: hypothetical protein QXD77_00455 [Candidatus Aenigmatarchaeota archaeon]